MVGAGPAGITTIGKLLDCGVDPGSIVWIDPEFRVGDLGKWANVSSNTTVGRFSEFLRSCDSFGIGESNTGFGIFSLNPKGTCLLKEVVQPLQWVSDRLVKTVVPQRTLVTSVGPEGDSWRIKLMTGELCAKNVVLAIGAEPKRLNHRIPQVSLEVALDPRRLKRAVRREDVVGVFGSSHSAILAVRNLLDAGVGRVVNFYRSPLRFAVDFGDWILYDNTGLKGVTAEWARNELARVPPERLLRIKVGDRNAGKYLARCNKVVYGVGFEPRRLQIQGADQTRYDQSTGVLAPGLFGCGIAFPEKVVDRAGNVEFNVGLLKFSNFLNRTVPAWMGRAEKGVPGFIRLADAKSAKSNRAHYKVVEGSVLT